MAQDPDKPRASGRVRLPKVDAAMNRRGPTARKGGKGGKAEDKDTVALQPGDQSSKEQREDAEDGELLAKIRKRFKRAADAEQDVRKEAVDDLKHKTGKGQWPAGIVAARNIDNKPTLTINKLPVFVRQVVNELRANRPEPKVSPVGQGSDRNVAKFYRGMLRAIERDSQADIAYETMFEHACDAGFGYLRILTEYEPKSFDKSIVIKRIRNRFSVYLDPLRQMPDGSDAKWGIITEMLPREDFEKEFPDADPCPWDQGAAGDAIMKEWISEQAIRIAEYYEIVYEDKRLVMLANGHVGYWDDLSEEAKELDIVSERTDAVASVKWYKVSAKEVLEETDWPGQWIPIIECIGNEDDVEGKVEKSGIIRAAKVPQHMYNWHRTLGVELTGLQPKAPFIIAHGQVEGFEDIWRTANTKSHPYLPYNETSVEGHVLPMPQRQQFLSANQGVIAETQQAAQDFMAVTGLRFDATLGERVYDESGRALKELQKKGDIGSFHYTANFARSLRFVAQQIIDLIPKVYDTKRLVTILREDDEEEQVLIDPNAQKGFQEARTSANAKLLKVYNPTVGRYGVTVTIGPAAATRRIEAFNSMIEILRVLPPQAAGVIGDLIVKNADWDGADEMAARLAKLLPPGMADDPSMKDVPPQAQAMITQMRQQLQQLSGERQQLLRALTDQQADRAQRQSKIDKDFEVKLLGILQKADTAYQQQVGSQLGELAEGVKMLEQALGQGAGAQPGGSPGGGAGQGGMPEGARQARDGNWYMADPQRPGKWLMVAQ